jgi:hypothetical protein
VVLGLSEQNVDMVADGIDFNERRVKVLEDACDIGVELAAFPVPEQWASGRGAKYEVNNDVGQ